MFHIYIDLDGPILDVSDRYYNVHQEILRRLNIEKRQEKKEYWSQKRNKISIENICEISKSDGKLTQYKNSWLKLIENKRYLQTDKLHNNEIRQTLFRLHSDNRLVLVTLRKNKENLFYQLKTLQLQSFFDLILTSSDQNESSDIKASLISSDALFDPSSSVVIGDTEFDIIAGKKLQVPTIAVLSGIRSGHILKSLKPDYILPNINFLPTILTNLSLTRA